MRYRAAAVQFEPSLGDKQQNMERLTAWIREAAGAGAKLIVLPEMGSTGYRFHSVDELAPLSEPVPGGPSTAHFERLAMELGIYLVAGLPEVEATTGKRYNTAVLLGPGGFVGKYRKIHLFDDDLTWATEGDLGFPVFDTPIGKIALVICMDLVFMESCRVGALAGADVIAAPVNWSASTMMWTARALENGTYLVCANRWGTERGSTYCGKSAIIGPQGQMLSDCPQGDGVAYAEVDTGLAQSQREVALARHRPVPYGAAVQSEPSGTQGCTIGVAVGQGQTAAEMAEQLNRAAITLDQESGSHLALMLFPACQEADFPLLAAAAHQAGCHVVGGSVDADGRQTAWLIGPDGRVEQRSANAVAGGDAGLVALPWGTVGLAVGEDLLAPEAVRSLALRGADLVAVVADWPETSPRWLWAVRWLENETPLIVANACGGSRIWHEGRPRPEAGPERDAVITATLAIGKVKEGFRFLRPAYYAGLAAECP